jgi:hypothetical protein
MRHKPWADDENFAITGVEVDKIIGLTIRECNEAVHWDERLDMEVLELRIRRVLDGEDED